MKIEKLDLDEYRATPVDGENTYNTKDLQLFELAEKINELIEYIK